MTNLNLSYRKNDIFYAKNNQKFCWFRSNLVLWSKIIEIGGGQFFARTLHMGHIIKAIWYYIIHRNFRNGKHSNYIDNTMSKCKTWNRNLDFYVARSSCYFSAMHWTLSIYLICSYLSLMQSHDHLPSNNMDLDDIFLFQSCIKQDYCVSQDCSSFVATVGD